MVMISRGIKLFLFLGRLLLGLFLFLHLGAADAVDGAQRAQALLPKRPLPLQLRLGLDGKARPRNGVQTGARNIRAVVPVTLATRRTASLR